MSPLISGLASVASLVFNAASSGAAKPAAPRRGSEEAQAQPSAVVTLSPQAEALAGFAGKGILVSQGKVDGALGGVQFLQGLASTSITRPGNDFSQAVLQLMDRSGIADGVVSQSEFAALATAFANAEKRVGAA
jgi:hypothetical protein